MNHPPKPADGMRYVDAHCHVDLFPDPHAVMREAAQEGVGILAVTNTPSVFEAMVRLAEPFPNVFVAVGLHPELAVERESELGLIPRLWPKTRFVGEVGLDGTKRDLRTQASQQRVLRSFLECVPKDPSKLMTVHSRRAGREILNALADVSANIILHWFSGSVAQAREAAARGWSFSVNSAMLSNVRGRALVASLPPKQVLTETDGPFVQVDGRPLRPVDVRRVVDDLASIWHVGHNEARIRVLENFRNCISARSGPHTSQSWEVKLLDEAPSGIPADAVISAIQQLLQVDRELLIRDVNERAITARLADHLRPRFPGWEVDCEYNRNDRDVKRADGGVVVPDVVVHRRGTDDNLLVIEVKKSNSTESDERDLEKLRAYRALPLTYRAALFLKVVVGPNGPDVQAIQWV